MAGEATSMRKATAMSRSLMVWNILFDESAVQNGKPTQPEQGELRQLSFDLLVMILHQER